MAAGKLFAISLTLIIVLATAVGAQNRNVEPEKCPGPIYGGKDVAQRAKIVNYADTSVLTRVATEYGFHGTIRADAVLCRSGRVTDIHLTKQLPRNLDEFVVAAIETTEFKPAESNWHTVSQRIQFEFSINDDSPVEQIDPAQAEGRLVERLEIMGNRTISVDRIESLIKITPGEPFRKETMEKDLQSVLASGFFDSKQTRVYTESGVRGGVGVVFEIVERPLINEIKFKGLPIDESIALENLKTLGVQSGARYSYEKMNQTLAMLERLLESKGHQTSKVVLQTTLVDSMTINLYFVISK